MKASQDVTRPFFLGISEAARQALVSRDHAHAESVAQKVNGALDPQSRSDIILGKEDAPDLLRPHHRIELLGLRPQLLWALKSADLHTVSDLTRMQPEDLAQEDRVGTEAVRRIQAILAPHSLALGEATETFRLPSEAVLSASVGSLEISDGLVFLLESRMGISTLRDFFFAGPDSRPRWREDLKEDLREQGLVLHFGEILSALVLIGIRLPHAEEMDFSADVAQFPVAS